ncbi:MAG: hypothetical protein QF752_00265 [Planctomycetota bacterium]|nr:hypothetical protein [Planctomycetota bacterium]
MTLRQARRLVGLSNLGLVVAVFAVALQVARARVPIFRSPPSAPAPPELRVNRFADEKEEFVSRYGVCWNWVPKPESLEGETLPVSVSKPFMPPLHQSIRILELNESPNQSLSHVVFEYRGTIPGFAEGKMEHQQVHQFVGHARAFLIGTRQLVRVLQVVKNDKEMGVWFEVLDSLDTKETLTTRREFIPYFALGKKKSGG